MGLPLPDKRPNTVSRCPEAEGALDGSMGALVLVVRPIAR